MRVFCPFFEKYFSYLRFFVFFQSLYCEISTKSRRKSHLCYGQTKNASVFACKCAGVFANAKIRLPSFCSASFFALLFTKHQPFFLYMIWFFVKRLMFQCLHEKKCTFRFYEPKGALFLWNWGVEFGRMQGRGANGLYCH